MSDTHARSIAKAISWRATGTLDTFLLSWLITGHLGTAGGIAASEIVTKISLYYLHERVWTRLGRRRGKAAETHRRSLLKAISWRVTGTLDTFLLSWLITGHAATAGGIAASEVLTKIALYYLHERVWALVPWGRPARPAMAGHAPLGGPAPLAARQ